MKRKIAVMLSLLLLLSGCRLAQPAAENGGDSNQGDLIIGVYLTPEYLDLFDIEGWINDNLDQLGDDIVIEGDTSAYEGRLYATYHEETERWEFEGLEGHSIFCWEQVADWGTGSVVQNTGGLADSHFATKVTDSGTENDITATLYVEPADLVCWYVNPVYQDSDGNVYLTAGSGNSFSDHTGGAGMSMSQTLTNEVTITDTDGKAETNKTTCKVTIETRRPPELVRILWMDAAHNVLRQAEYGPGELPPELDAREAAYLVVEETEAGGEVRYTLFQREDNSQGVRIYVPGDHGVLIAHDVPVFWEDETTER